MRCWIAVTLPLLPLQALHPRWCEPLPLAIIDGGEVVALSRLAAAQGVRHGMRANGVQAIAPDIRDAAKRQGVPVKLEFIDRDKALETMKKKSPLMMCVTLEQIRRAATMSIADCLKMERTMVRRCFENGEVIEGVRALVIDKDHAPAWTPATQDDVTPEMVDRFFDSAWPGYADSLRSLG